MPLLALHVMKKKTENPVYVLSTMEITGASKNFEEQGRFVQYLRQSTPSKEVF